ncbi:MAG: carboxylating nicotinate-nucleotide diphosphorylase [Actinobacteria bacterium]|uniref:Probable nicotinate-nucleotide pyrophosphorylase [carboxylating] n=1 Tax=freshwater metagenome TaxID=449393 RepID=A0A6J7GYU7_9ZZZZ|nr:carboxylating nicotinate-nucleotide diphosphorylase [Actinomycetota bacterium]MSW91481.1 carboxylating nicotinate-nucleotide diphosphorylase [Actinomycetota bacterium]MSX87751.1 carboxylating nicotinate-nucleotide diphosphorylase [Actinomycetota bacterium]MSY73518.1 carboxylating nicotinate-nucleotide diphosphorylase [Actinomycetota bacterium]
MADPLVHPPVHAVREAVARALAEDLTPLGDLSAALLPADIAARATFVSRGRGVVAGTWCAGEAFHQLDPSLVVAWVLDDGDRVEPGSVIGTVDGPIGSILSAERTALNFLGHLSGVATRVRQFVDRAGPGIRVWDTRKTTPGLRSLEKAAVRAGGGRNHRGNLSDWVMLKDNHLMGIGITAGVALAKDRWPGRTVHVEAERLAQVLEAAAAGADAILLDNMTPDEVRECVVAVVAAYGSRRPLLEVSGGITLETIASYAATGADLVSSGSLTNSAPVLDIGLDILRADDVRVR